MYIPNINTMEDHVEILEFIEKNSFATLITVTTEGVPIATHIPIELDFSIEDNPTLRGHVAIMNPQARLFTENPRALAIFTGAHTYISSSWYEKENVSTWNYSAVHVYGKIRILTPTELWESVEKLTAKYEKPMQNPRFMNTMNTEFLKKEIKGIVGFEMTIEDVQAKKKWSQNRKDADYKNIIQELEQSDNPQSQEMAEQMKKNRPHI